MKLYNRNFAVGERIEFMGWVSESVINNNISWQTYKPRFLVLKGTEVMLFDSPPVKHNHLFNISFNILDSNFKFVGVLYSNCIVKRGQSCKASQCV